MPLLFDEENHRYYLDSRPLPGVTSVLNGAAAYAGVSPDVLEEASRRGTYIHQCCEMLVWGSLDLDSVPDHLRAYIHAFDRWLVEVKPEIELTEERVWHRRFMYAGTLDLKCKIRRRSRVIRNVTDIKTTYRLMSMVGPQLAAYREAYNSAGGNDRIEARYGLQLQKDGRYKFHEYTDPTDFEIFKSCLNVHNFFLKDKENGYSQEG